MGVGRPTKFKPAYCSEVIAAGQEGLSLTAFAGSIGVCRDTVNEWTREHPEFSDAVKVHQAKRTEYLERTLLSSEQGPKVTARIFALKNADPENWKDKHEHDVGGNLTVQIMRFSE
jgi:hypothetical protein